MDKIYAGIVTFNPDIKRLFENIAAISPQVEKVIVFDNGSKNESEIIQLCTQINNVEIICHKINAGIAFALNRIIERADEDNVEWVLTLDQDSVCFSNIISNYNKYLKFENVGMIICDYTDRNYSFKREEKRREYDYIRKCITSGCLTNVAAVKKVGMFDEKLFIDSVDYDMCYSLQEYGYLILNVHFDGFLHEVGKSKGYNLLGFEFAVTNHSPLRKYYISRNSTYMIKKHKLNPITENFVIYRRILTVLIFEKQKIEKVKAILKGIHDGKRM